MFNQTQTRPFTIHTHTHVMLLRYVTASSADSTAFSTSNYWQRQVGESLDTRCKRRKYKLHLYTYCGAIGEDQVFK